MLLSIERYKKLSCFRDLYFNIENSDNRSQLNWNMVFLEIISTEVKLF